MKRYLLVMVEGGEITLIDTITKKEFSANWEDVDIQVFLQEEEDEDQPELGL
jgi:hypothetical protein